jgi:colanic acid/amylovoran biosynthesis glycosyltransferase
LKTLAYFCNYFPYGQKEPLAETELFELAKNFDQVLIFPFFQEETQRTIPPNARLVWFRKSTFQATKTCQSWHEIQELWKDVPELSSFHSYNQSIAYKIRAAKIHASIITQELIKYQNITLFSPWIFPWGPTLALTKTILFNLGIHATFFLRANGADLYPERLTSTKKKLQLFSMHHATKVFSVSNHGVQTIIQQYPRLQSKITAAYHGIGPLQLGPIPNATKLKWVSCSTFHPVKQLHRIVAIAAHCNQEILWTHFGGYDIEIEQFKKEIEHSIPKNLQIVFAGRKKQKEILEQYEQQAFDLFLNVSDTEGLPLSAVEALHAGIPILLSNVGGSSEIGTTVSVQPFRADEWANEAIAKCFNSRNQSIRKEIQTKARTLFSLNNYVFLAKEISPEIHGSAVIMDDNLPGFSIASSLLKGGIPSNNVAVMRQRVGRMSALNILDFNHQTTESPWFLFPLNESQWEKATELVQEDNRFKLTYNAQSFQLSTNKFKQMEWAQKKGIPTIPTTTSLNPAEWDFPFPVLVKPLNKGAKNYTGARLWIIQNLNQWNNDKHLFDQEKICIQPFYENAMVAATVGYCTKDGHITSVFSAERVRCYPDTFSMFSSVSVTKIPEIINYCTQFLEHSNVQGIFEMEFLLVNNQWHFLELNNRATTWIGAEFWSGTSPILDALNEAYGLEISVKKQVGSGWWIHKKNEWGNLKYKSDQIWWLLFLWKNRKNAKWV